MATTRQRRRFAILSTAMATSSAAMGWNNTMGKPVNGVVEVAGPEPFRFDALIQQWLEAHNDPRTVVADPSARYYGTLLSERSLVPAGDARLGAIRFEDWLRQPAPQRRRTSVT